MMTAKPNHAVHEDLVLPASLLAGKYRVHKVLGQGGMSTVVAATHEVLGHCVAIKYLRRPDDDTTAARLLREARMLVKLRGEYIARVLDVGQLDNGAPFLVMEYLEGTDLAQHLHHVGPLPVDEAIDYLLQTCVAMAEAHACGIVHRDLKPANLFLTKSNDGTRIIKVIDFGISKANVDHDDPQLTQTDAIFGSPRYMSPEQLHASKFVDPRSDIWSLGVTLYHLLTQAFPFEGTTVAELVLAVHSDEPAKMSTFRRDLPVGLERVVRTCLFREKQQRFANVAQFARRLAEFGGTNSMARVEAIERILGSGNEIESAEDRTVDLVPVNSELSCAPEHDRPSENLRPSAASWPSSVTMRLDALHSTRLEARVSRNFIVPVLAGFMMISVPSGTMFIVQQLRRTNQASLHTSRVWSRALRDTHAEYTRQTLELEPGSDDPSAEVVPTSTNTPLERVPVKTRALRQSLPKPTTTTSRVLVDFDHPQASP